MEAPIDDTILRSLAAGSMATLLLVQGVGAPTTSTHPDLACADRCISPPLDGSVDLRTIFLRDSVGITVLNNQVAWNAPLERPGEPDVADLPYLLKQRTGLAIEILAKAVGVSKVTYHKWLNGAGISEESRDRLVEIQSTLAALVSIRPGLRRFLDLQTPLGTPLELLSRRQDALVLGLATRGDQIFDETPFGAGPQREGLRRVRPIGWSRSVERDRREELSPSAAQDEEVEALIEGEPLAVGYVLFRA
jgi:hypothetical protein